MTRKGFLNGLLAAGAMPALVSASVLGADAPSNKLAVGALGEEGRRECVFTQPERAWHSDLIAQIGMHAIKRGHRLDFDLATCSYKNDSDANKLLKTRPYLNGWSLNDVRV